MTAVANEADFFLASFWAFASSWASTDAVPPSPWLLEWPLEVDPEPDPVEASHLLSEARPRTSSAISAADFFLVFSSSEDRLDDMIVSRVPYATLLRRAPPRLLRCERATLSSSSELMACRVGPPPLWLWLCPLVLGVEEAEGRLAAKARPDP